MPKAIPDELNQQHVVKRGVMCYGMTVRPIHPKQSWGSLSDISLVKFSTTVSSVGERASERNSSKARLSD